MCKLAHWKLEYNKHAQPDWCSSPPPPYSHWSIVYNVTFFYSDASSEDRVTASTDGSSLSEGLERPPPVPPRKSTSNSPSHSPASLRREVSKWTGHLCYLKPLGMYYKWWRMSGILARHTSSAGKLKVHRLNWNVPKLCSCKAYSLLSLELHVHCKELLLAMW